MQRAAGAQRRKPTTPGRVTNPKHYHSADSGGASASEHHFPPHRCLISLAGLEFRAIGSDMNIPIPTVAENPNYKDFTNVSHINIQGPRGPVKLYPMKSRRGIGKKQFCFEIEGCAPREWCLPISASFTSRADVPLGISHNAQNPRSMDSGRQRSTRLFQSLRFGNELPVFYDDLGRESSDTTR